MEIKWYWLAEKLGLMEYVQTEYADGSIHEEMLVMREAEEVFSAVTLGLLPFCFIVGLLLRCFLRERAGKTAVGAVCWGFGSYAVLLAVGIGPYIKFFPRGGGFLDLSAINHIFDGLYFTLLALLVFLGGLLGKRFSRFRKEKTTK